jgi:DNA-binding response OmpR family regulator
MPAAAESPASPSRILVVEDEPLVCELLSDIVQAEGFEPWCVQTDEDAMAALVEARSFACLIVDVNLGSGVTGYDVARRARLNRANLPVIFVSGQTSDHSYKANGVPDSLFVAKPFTADELAEQIHKLLGDNDV